MDVLRAEQPRALSRGGVLLAHAGQGRTRAANARARGLDGEGLSGLRRDGEASRRERLLCRRPLHDRRHRTVWLYPRRTRVRLRARRIPRDPCLAQSRCRSARARADGLASGGRSRATGAYSLLMPASLMTLAHFAVSMRMMVAKASGGSETTSRPILPKFSTSCGCRTISTA